MAITKPKFNAYSFWAMRFWHGMLLGDWLRFLLPRCFRVHPFRIGLALTVSFAAAVNSLLRGLQRLLYGRAIAATPIDKPPLIIVGHWRSGTTLLHELLVLDDQFAFPTTYECFAANHFVLTGRWLPPLLSILLPAKRPMDDMAVSFAHPQEDEFALISMGAPTPMLRLAFPNDPPLHLETLDMEGVAARDLERWKESVVQFVRAQTYLKGKPVVLKSPPHTGRIGVLAELFPGAKFVHLVRDPLILFASTRRLWMAWEELQGFQLPHYEGLNAHVFDAFERMYRGFERQRGLIDPKRICDVRYEDLVRDPEGELQRIYTHLALGDFGRIRQQVQSYFSGKQNYRVNRHELEPEVEAEVRRRWAGYSEKYGYAAR